MDADSIRGAQPVQLPARRTTENGSIVIILPERKRREMVTDECSEKAPPRKKNDFVSNAAAWIPFGKNESRIKCNDEHGIEDLNLHTCKCWHLRPANTRLSRRGVSSVDDDSHRSGRK